MRPPMSLGEQGKYFTPHRPYYNLVNALIKYSIVRGGADCTALP